MKQPTEAERDAGWPTKTTIKAEAAADFLAWLDADTPPPPGLVELWERTRHIPPEVVDGDLRAPDPTLAAYDGMQGHLVVETGHGLPYTAHRSTGRCHVPEFVELPAEAAAYIAVPCRGERCFPDADPS